MSALELIVKSIMSSQRLIRTEARVCERAGVIVKRLISPIYVFTGKTIEIAMACG